MSAEYPTLAEVPNWHQPVAFSSRPHSLWCQKCLRHWPTDEFFPHQADAWREACTIRTAEQVLNLPAGVVHSNHDGAIELFADGHWYLPGRRDAIAFRRVLDNLPALLIWHPSWSRP